MNVDILGMNNKKLLLITLLQVVLITAAKAYLFKVLSFQSAFGLYLSWAATAVIAAALVRRIGVINFLEAFFVCVLWFIADGFIDLIFTSGLLGLQIFSHWPLWIGYLVTFLAVFLFHKKRHVHIRHEQHAGRFIRH